MRFANKLTKPQRKDLQSVILVTVISPVLLSFTSFYDLEPGSSTMMYASYVGFAASCIGIYMSIRLLQKKIIPMLSIIITIVNIMYMLLNATTAFN